MWKPRADAFFVLGLAIAAIAAVCLALLQPGPFDVVPPKLANFIKDYQTLISAFAALLGVYVAYRNVSRQVQQSREAMIISIVGREEDRIEREVPALVSAVRFLIGARMWNDRPNIGSDLHDEMARSAALFDTIEDARTGVAKLLPNISPGQHNRIASTLFLLSAFAVERSTLYSRLSESRANGENEKLLQQLIEKNDEGIQKILSDIDDLADKLLERVNLLADRLPSLRAKIDSLMQTIESEFRSAEENVGRRSRLKPVPDWVI